MLLKDPFLRISLTRILKHPTLWKFDQVKKEDLIKEVKNLQKEMDHQKEIAYQLEKQIQKFNQFKNEMIEKNQLISVTLEDFNTSTDHIPFLQTQNKILKHNGKLLFFEMNEVKKLN
jgi:hypothetical protein